MFAIGLDYIMLTANGSRTKVLLVVAPGQRQLLGPTQSRPVVLSAVSVCLSDSAVHCGQTVQDLPIVCIVCTTVGM